MKIDEQNQSPEKLEELYQFGKSLKAEPQPPVSGSGRNFHRGWGADRPQCGAGNPQP